MKKLLLSIAALLLSVLNLQAQLFLYGMTLNGGTSDLGVIFSYAPATNTYYKLKDFTGPEGAHPTGYLTKATDGLLYGLTHNGGTNGMGVIFSFDPATNIYTKLKDFTGPEGAGPESNLTLASNGLFYGMTRFGGDNNAGVLFSFNPGTNTYSKLKDFGGVDGDNPIGDLTQASNGLLYGYPSIDGPLFSFDPSTNTFTGYEGASGDVGHLVEAQNGLLYGQNSRGGIYSFDPSTNTSTPLGGACCTQTEAFGSLVRASNGLLYGMTKGFSSKGISTPGTIFSFDPSTNSYTKQMEFTNSAQGLSPLGSLMQASNGLLYGMTSAGGMNNKGVIFSFDPVAKTYTALRDFTGPDGANPWWNSTLLELSSAPPCTPPAFRNDATIVLDADCSGKGGLITLIPTSGTAPFLYSIDGGATYVEGPATGYSFQELRAGSYQLRLKDANGCESTVLTKEVHKYFGGPLFKNDGTIVLDASCGKNDGNISIIPTCGAAPFLYSIDGGMTYVNGPITGYTFQNLAPGTYQLRLKDSYGTESAIVTREVRPDMFGPCATVTAAGPRTRPAQVKDASVTLRAFPNPSKGRFQVQLGRFSSPRVQLQVVDARGAVLQQRTLYTEQKSVVDIDLSGKAKGLYLIRVVSDKGTQQTKVMIQ